MDVTKTNAVVVGGAEALYLTRVGKLGYGDDVNREIVKVIQFRHDILLRAAREKLDVAILCGSLRAALQSVFTPKYTNGRTFDQSLREVCEAGNSVRVLLWNEPKPQLVDPAIARLVNEIKSRRDRSESIGDLEIRISGTEAGWQQVSHFVLAYDPRILNPACAPVRCPQLRLRLESPHPSPSEMAEPVRESDEMPALISFFPPPPGGSGVYGPTGVAPEGSCEQIVDGSGVTARDYGPKLLSTFQTLWDKALPVRFADR